MAAVLEQKVTLTYKTTTCISCGVEICLPSDFYDNRLETKKDYYCPNGHSQHFVSKTREQELREQVERERKAHEWTRQELQLEKNSHRASRGVITKLRVRVGSGVCPCCTRSFVNLQRHMATKHPTFSKERKV